ncbi:hypothetical protein V6Z12_D03G194400 [Gossypium hirsutum]
MIYISVLAVIYADRNMSFVTTRRQEETSNDLC